MFPAAYRSLLLPKIFFQGLCGIITTNMMHHGEDASSSGSSSSSENYVHRFPQVQGYGEDKHNDVLYHPPKMGFSSAGKVLYFGGDVQDYRENMLKHRDNQRHVQWCLEQTAVILHRHFPLHEIYIIKPSRMSLGTFSCYNNFVTSDNTGAPNHSLNTMALKHLKSLLSSLQALVTAKDDVCAAEDSCKDAIGRSSGQVATTSNDQLILIGFSKGCAVLNQILYSIHALESNPDPELTDFCKSFKEMYWLDGGHSGGSNTWVTNKKVLQSFVKLDVDVNIFVTPYQVSCIFRPWIGKEEKMFRETLKKLGARVRRELCFKEEPSSLDYHFRVLEVFTPSPKKEEPLPSGGCLN